MTEPLREVFFTESQIQSAVERLTAQILAWLKDHKTNRLNLVSILEGAKPFTKDLTACLKKTAPGVHVKLHEIRIKGTDGHQHLLSNREVQDGYLDLDSMRENPTLIVDDLVDSGMTLEKLKEQLLTHGVVLVRTTVLIRKFGMKSGPVDFLGFDLNLNSQDLAQRGYRDCWLYGYGMDLDGEHRELPRVEGIYIGLDP